MKNAFCRHCLPMAANAGFNELFKTAVGYLYVDILSDVYRGWILPGISGLAAIILALPWWDLS